MTHPYGDLMVRYEQLTVKLVATGDVLWVRIDGELDLSTSHLVDSCTTEARRHRDTTGGLVLDLRKVTFCDAAGVRAIAQVHGWATTRGIACELWPSPAVRRIVDAAGCEKLLDGGS